ncbi:MAG: MarR family transcriptional regulator [Methyloprofundus sp.]|nr:MarR family transcriptional regulator [Methyloprofundus sp.]
MNIDKFSKISESLRQYRRAELRDFEREIGAKPIDQLYVDALPGNAVLNSVLSSNTTFLLGRKGTGKSTVFAKAQSTLREEKEIISVYVDVKSLIEVLDNSEVPDKELKTYGISMVAYRSHLLRKAMLGRVIAELLKEVTVNSSKLTLLDRWRGVKKQYDDLMQNLSDIALKVKSAKLEEHEIPILQKISSQIRQQKQKEKSSQATNTAAVKSKASLINVSMNAELSESSKDFDKTLDDAETYNEYSDVVLKSFPFGEIIEQIQSLISEAGLLRLVVFFDDFSELNFVDQRLFVDVVLSPLNNSSNEAVKLKVSAYPGRVYYGKIDPGKADTISLDFSDLYESNEVQEMERSAADYAERLIMTRFKAFDVELSDYFDFSSDLERSEMMKLLFQASFNVPRIIGHLLHTLYLDRISKNQKITNASIRLASKKYYEGTIEKYFDRMNRYALEPFENKLDRHNQNELLKLLIKEAKDVKKRILNGKVGGSYFADIPGTPPTSHFIVNPELEVVLASLEQNFFVSRYKKVSDKDGADVIVYALFLGLCESERMAWGYPEGRHYRQYFRQRCFDYTRVVHQFLSRNKTIKCNYCSACHSMDLKASLELYKWRCPDCSEGICTITNLSDDFKDEVGKLDQGIMLEPVELEIVSVINDENRRMRAGEISALIDTTHQLVGRRTSKLQDMGLIVKERDERDNHMKSTITQRCKDTYFM